MSLMTKRLDFNGGYYTDIGNTEIMDESTLENIQLSVVPHEGVHKNIKYIILIHIPFCIFISFYWFLFSFCDDPCESF